MCPCSQHVIGMPEILLAIRSMAAAPLFEDTTTFVESGATTMDAVPDGTQTCQGFYFQLHRKPHAKTGPDEARKRKVLVERLHSTYAIYVAELLSSGTPLAIHECTEDVEDRGVVFELCLFVPDSDAQFCFLSTPAGLVPHPPPSGIVWWSQVANRNFSHMPHNVGRANKMCAKVHGSLERRH